MDTLFPRTFVLVFSQLAVGGMFCLSIPPFHDMDRGYYKSSTFVYWGIGCLATIGHVALWRRPDSSVGGVEVLLWTLFCVFGGAYLASLWYEYFIVRARLFMATWATGLVALLGSAWAFADQSGVAMAHLTYPITFVLAALVLGAAGTGMLLGHWYLIDRNLSLTPLWNVLQTYLGVLAAQIVVLAASAGYLALAGGGAASFWSDYGTVFLGRIAISPIGTTVLALMIWRTLQIPQTMAATGLFYIAILAATVGELIGRYLLFRTGLPM